MAADAMKLRILKILGSGALTSLVLTSCNSETHLAAPPAVGSGQAMAGTGMIGQAAGGASAHAAGGSQDNATGTGGAVSHTPGTGGTPGTAGTPGTGLFDAGLPPNCHASSVGTCCDTDVCFSHAQVVLRLTSAGVDVSFAGDSDGGLTSCPETMPREGFCTWYSDLRMETEHECCYVRTTGSCCGRPFLVGGVARQAAVRLRSDWFAAHAIGATHLDRSTRAALARAWLDDARLEHASIASFARFTLQLLELGAPADLVGDAQHAALDEVEHARLCFALASRYAGEPLGPGKLATHEGSAPVTLAAAAAAAVHEGCVGETLAAIQVRAQLALATDPDVRAALARIADDEARHAELAWRFVRWAIATGDTSVGASVATAFRDALAALGAQPPARDLEGVTPDAWHAHGRLTPAEERAGHLDAAHAVIAPCMQELLRA